MTTSTATLAAIRAGLAQLNPARCPGGVSPVRWPDMVDAARAFADQWATKALELGWSEVELFGLDPAAPQSRYDGSGLAFLLQPKDRIVEMNATEAVFERANGTRLRFSRARHSPRSVPAWNLAPGGPSQKGAVG